MAAFIVKTFRDVIDAIVEELKLSPNDTDELNRIRRDVNIVYNNVASAPGARWNWLSRHKQIEFKPYLANGTVSVTPGSTTIQFSVAPTTSKKGYMFSVENFSEIYYIESHTANSTTAVLGTPWTGQLYTGVAYKVWTDSVILPTDCQETQEVYHQFSNQPLEGVGLQEFRRRVALDPKRQGRPEFYCTYDYEDPTDHDGETETDRYLVMRVHPSIYQNSTTLNIDYVREVLPLELDLDEPMMPVTDRPVLVYGGLEKAWKRFRNTEAGEQSKRDYQEKLAQMQGRVSDSQDTPQITPNSQYLARKRGRVPSRNIAALSGAGSYTAPSYLKNAIIEGAQVTANISVNPGVTVDGVDISALNSQVQNHISATSGAHAASAISVVPSGAIVSTNVQNALQEISAAQQAAATAAGVSFTPSGTISSNNVQDAIQELDGDISALASDVVASVNTLQGDVTISAGTNVSLNQVGQDIQINVSSGGGIGDVTGPASSVDNTLPRYDGTTGKLLQGSGVVVSDTNAVSGITNLTATGTTTLSTSLSGVVKAASGVLSASTVVNADVSASAAIALSKLAALTASRAVVTNGSGVLTAATTTSTEIGYVNGVTSAIQTQLNAKSPKLNDTGAGETVIASSSTGQVKKLIAGTNVTLTPGTDNVTISASVSGSSSYVPSVLTRITATGSSTYNLPYAFASSSSVTTVAGDTYTHNSVTYTVVVSATDSVPVLSGGSAPLSSGTLTRATGTGATSITFTSFRAPIELENTIVGGGGGGGAGTGGSGGSSGGSSTMNGVTAAGGYGGTSSAGLAGGGGAVSGNVAGLTEVAIEGNDGATASVSAGGIGGIGYFGGQGRPGRAGVGDYGEHSAANSGAGGAGGATTNGNYGGGGGGAGGVYKGVIRNPAATYAVTVGTGGAGGAGGVSGTTGTNGGSGVVIIKAKWQ